MRKIFTLAVIFLITVASMPVAPAQAISSAALNATVQVLCPDDAGNWFSGSGTMIHSSGIVMTNRHVVLDTNSNVIPFCYVGLTTSLTEEPSFDYVAEVKYWSTDEDIDVAFLYIDNKLNENFSAIDVFAYDTSGLQLGETLEIVGYPSVGSSTVTYVSGVMSGYFGDYIKSTAPIEQGNSGGGAYNVSGQFIGLPTFVVAGNYNTISYILNINSVKNWLVSQFGSSYQTPLYSATADPSAESSIISQTADQSAPDANDVWGWVYTDSTMTEEIEYEVYQSDSTPFMTWDGFYDESGIEGYYVYFGQDINANPATEGIYYKTDSYSPLVNNGDGIYYLIVKAKDNNGNVSSGVYWMYYYQADSVVTPDPEPQDSPEVIVPNSTPPASTPDSSYDPYELNQPIATTPGSLAGSLSGRILLQVERNGEGWYIYPENNKRYFLGRPADAFSIMRELGLGATHSYITKYTVYPRQVWGKILLDVEMNGEAYYVNPVDGKAYYLGRPDDAFRIMRELGLGISNQNLANIPFDILSL
ncbi:hypothetical protein COT97_04060 [Candidatus Falkowbacteria bacterium CG10_big_fil_rev_8_21_14_0_10_39_11]|uniref:Serine protease n=1 Tax=Candidatus Falkowbacteria bacterium CG10_big_fil_rev_8_21_14_0_10_39_11 TaxID=1974565 RepID=A0A2H0V467_9BACT|nr:MAG: hypothetical protein COT97_04060 [Candidatus Falkowbacteria bacterium CG10_big_fil_rev_8_21_14_0_10_39_11]